MNPFLLSAKERLADWKTFRDDLKNHPEADQIERVRKYWSQAPVVKFAHDPEAPDTWPGPWEMIMDGDWSRDSVAIGMEFTLRLAGWDASRLVLKLVKDLDIEDVIFVLEIDNKRQIGYHYYQELPTQLTFCSWSFSGKRYAPVLDK